MEPGSSWLVDPFLVVGRLLVELIGLVGMIDLLGELDSKACLVTELVGLD